MKSCKTPKGWGAIGGPELPDDLHPFIHFSAIEPTASGPSMRANRVDFDSVPAQQDSFGSSPPGPGCSEN